MENAICIYIYMKLQKFNFKIIQLDDGCVWKYGTPKSTAWSDTPKDHIIGIFNHLSILPYKCRFNYKVIWVK